MNKVNYNRPELNERVSIKPGEVHLGLLVELGTYLFTNRKYREANIAFSEAYNLAVNSYGRRRVREWWKNCEGKAVVFSGKVKSLRGASARVIAIPEGFEASFWRNRPVLSSLREGDSVRFNVGFSAEGSVANIV
jgi:hypothetical protein